ncbi:MAG: FkbM family methyltransferase [Deltaproteobacteria bacterium]|nr:FkbM family methyltransferase [Deltaproteobacteria bacterium]
MPAPASAPQESNPSRTYFAEQGEDVIIAKIFESLHIERPTYLDVGAFDPVKDNNTYLLYTRGSQGVLVEPNPVYAERLRSVRPRDKVLGVGIGVTEQREADYYVIEGAPELNTFSKADADVLAATRGPQAIQQVLKLPLVNINTVIAKNLGSTPDLLSIDVGGLDLAILKTLDFKKYRPPVICVETVVEGTHEQNDEIFAFLAAKGYLIRGMTFINTVFVDLQRLQLLRPGNQRVPR